MIDVKEQVYRGLSNNLQAAIDTGNIDAGVALLEAAKLTSIDAVQYDELRQDFETAFGVDV